MPCQILISNKSSLPSGYIVALLDSDHIFSPNETFNAWVRGGNNPAEWGRSFTLVKITDKTRDELLFLLDPYVINGGIEPISNGRKYSFVEPSKDSALYKMLLDDGESETAWSIAEPYLVERE
ncbi:MAG: hypothetical protein GY928_16495 [Colwellia sp.]|nr:hypothetical protein [Colwellia sp.]